MAIAPMTFPVLSFEDANPFLKGLKTGGDLSEQMMKNLERSIALKYADDMQRAKLAAEQEEAPYKSAQTRSILEGDLPYKQAQTGRVNTLTPLEAAHFRAQVRSILEGDLPYKQAQSRLILEGDLPYKQAETDKVRTITPLEAELKKFKLAHPLLSMTGDAAQVGAAKYLTEEEQNKLKSLPTKDTRLTGEQIPESSYEQLATAANTIRPGSTRIQQDNSVSDALSNILSNKAQTGNIYQDTTRGNITGDISSKIRDAIAFDPTATTENIALPKVEQQLPDGQIPQQEYSFANMLQNAIATNAASKKARSDYYSNPYVQMRGVINSPALQSLASTNPEVAKNLSSILAQGMGVDAKTLTPKDYEEMQKNLADNLYRKNNTAQIMNQRQYAGILDSLFERGTSLIPDVAQYAGLATQGKKGLDALKSAFGKSSPTYQNYLLFTRSLAPLLANEMRRTLGGQASDKEQQAMNNLANPSWIDSNPSQALTQYQFLSDVYKSSVNPALANRPTETLSQLRGDSIRPSNQSPQTNQQPASTQNMVPVISTKTGRTGYVSVDKIDAAVKSGKFKRA